MMAFCAQAQCHHHRSYGNKTNFRPNHSGGRKVKNYNEPFSKKYWFLIAGRDSDIVFMGKRNRKGCPTNCTIVTNDINKAYRFIKTIKHFNWYERMLIRRELRKEFSKLRVGNRKLHVGNRKLRVGNSLFAYRKS
jgi:hypothetical protein